MNNRNIKTLSAQILNKAHSLNPRRKWNEISIILVNDMQIMNINKQYFNKHEVTDVISLCFNPMPGEHQTRSGEIIINVQCAAQEGSTRKKTNPSREMALYLAHGFDHLYDQNDDDIPSRNKMRRREQKWLKALTPQSSSEPQGNTKLVLIDNLFKL